MAAERERVQTVKKNDVILRKYLVHYQKRNEQKVGMAPGAVVNGVAVMYGVTLLRLGAAQYFLVSFVGVVLKSPSCHDMLSPLAAEA